MKSGGYFYLSCNKLGVVCPVEDPLPILFGQRHLWMPHSCCGQDRKKVGVGVMRNGDQRRERDGARVRETIQKEGAAADDDGEAKKVSNC